MTHKTSPPPPEGLAADAKRFWERMHDEYDFSDPDSEQLLVEAVWQMHRASQYREILNAEGLTFEDRWGQKREHPAAPAERSAVSIFQRLLWKMGLEDEG